LKTANSNYAIFNKVALV